VIPGVEWRGIYVTSPPVFAWYFVLSAAALKFLALRRMTALSTVRALAASITIGAASSYLVAVAPVALML
jgi:hypothetical protein